MRAWDYAAHAVTQAVRARATAPSTGAPVRGIEEGQRPSIHKGYADKLYFIPQQSQKCGCWY